jgi:hypothetical protein
MTALPSNLVMVGEDLARATSRDAQRSLRRRRAVTLAVALAILVVTATAAIANGWLFGETPTLRAVPALGSVPPRGAFAPGDAVAAAAGVAQSQAGHRAASAGSGSAAPLGSIQNGASRTLLANLGSERRALRSVTTSTGGVCLVLTGFAPECIPTFTGDQKLAWVLGSPSAGTTVVYGIARDAVAGVDAVTSDGRTIAARLANNAFYLEVSGGQPVQLIAHLGDGSSETLSLLPCPATDPSCAK